MAISYYINAAAIATSLAPVVTALMTLVTSNEKKMLITIQKNATAEAITGATAGALI